MIRLLRQSTAFTFRIGPFSDSTDGVTAETALSIGQSNIQISKDGGAFAQTSATPTTTHDARGWYQCPLTATDTNTLGPLTVEISMTGACPVWEHFMVVPANVYDSLVDGTDLLDANVSQFGGTNGTFSSGRPEVNSTHWGGTAVASATVRATLEQILGTTITEGAAGRVAAAFQTLFNVASPVLTAASVNQTGDSYARIGANGVSLSAIPDLAGVTTLLSRLSATRAGYLDNLSAGAVAQASALATVAGYIDTEVASLVTDMATVLSRLSSARAGYLDNLSAGAVAQASALATVAGYIDTEVASLVSDMVTVLARLDVAVSTRLASAGYTAPPDASAIRSAIGMASANLDTQLSGINSKTTNLPSDPADASDIAAAIVTVQADLDDIQTRLPAALVGGRMDSNASAINNVSAAAARLALSAGQIIPGTVDNTAFSPTTTQLEAANITDAAASHYVGRVIIFTSGTLAGQAVSISAYSLNAGRGRFTFSAATSAPANGVTFVVV